jgi:glycosyltransferase involved in cell wall biosynthesis
MRLLILNWRCPTQPNAGGAELLTLRIAERLVAWGHSVTWFAAAYPGAARDEMISGIRIIRAGSQSTVHLQAFRWYRRHGRGQFDAVIDEINTVPFLAHRYTGLPSVAFILQLAREVWWYEAPLPLAALGYLLEPLYLLAYRRLPVITISDSSAASLRAHGLRGPIAVIPMATDFVSEPLLPPLADKESEGTLVCLGRVVASKRVDHAIRALPLLGAMGFSVRLWVVGPVMPAYRLRLERLAGALGVGDAVTFWGKVDEDRKRALLRRAHLLVACSAREGWGLMVTEANTVGTPAVVYDVPGLRDSTHAGETGLVCDPATPAGMAGAIARLLSDPSEYARLRAAAWEQSRRLNWDQTAHGFLAAVEAALARPTSQTRARRQEARN